MPKTKMPKPAARVYRAASYARLSVDDESYGTSGSVLNQHAMIRDFADANGGLSIVAEYSAVWLPTHHGDVCEAVLPDGFREAFDAVLVHGIGDVRRMVLDGRHFDLLDGEPLLRLPVLVEHARQTEAFGDVVYSSHSPSSLPRFS